jgi:hypothetical protein
MSFKRILAVARAIQGIPNYSKRQVIPAIKRNLKWFQEFEKETISFSPSPNEDKQWKSVYQNRSESFYSTVGAFDVTSSGKEVTYSNKKESPLDFLEYCYNI